jgi:formylglycine-generating enzyme required for sulfatase activity
MVRIGTYCIDATEVTAAQYALFVAAGVRIDTQPLECAFNTSFAPNVQIAADNLPARFVDWCDARAYCAWAGKRLCGAVGGGPSLYANPDLPHEEWFMACSANNTRAYPYGQTYEAGACNAVAGGGDAPVFVGSKMGCEGGFPGLFDMSGNVREWTNACNSEVDGGTEECITRGGASDDLADRLTCGNRETDPRKYTSVRLGFRCCSDALL